MQSLVRSRVQGDTKEPKSRRVRTKEPSKRKVQTEEQMLEKARAILTAAEPSRRRYLANNKLSIRPWTSAELDGLLKKGHLVHGAYELSDMTPEQARHYCVRKLLLEGFLHKDKFGEYKVAPQRITQVS